jgi:hypothetical protein
MAGQIMTDPAANRDEGQTIIRCTRRCHRAFVPRLIVMRDGRLTSDEVLAEGRPPGVRAGSNEVRTYPGRSPLGSP